MINPLGSIAVKVNNIYTFLLFFVIYGFNAWSLVLEDLPKEKLEKLLVGKTVGFYIGSFDPIHKGHEQVIASALKHKVDYIIIYPAWGGDKYKNRTDIKTRLNMLRALYKKDPRVITTKLPPVELQKRLTKKSCKKVSGRPAVQPFFDAEYVGILGSDAALSMAEDSKKRSVFMRGIQISEKHAHSTIGGIMALPVHEFIVFIREGDNIDILNNRIGSRPFTSVALQDYKGISSTKVRKDNKEKNDISGLVSPQVIEIIKKNKLYT